MDKFAESKILNVIANARTKTPNTKKPNTKTKRQCCETCKYYIFHTGVCTNADSPFVADFNMANDVCRAYARKLSESYEYECKYRQKYRNKAKEKKAGQ